MNWIALNTDTHHQKPDTYRSNSPCPFCNKAGLRAEKRIVQEKEGMVLIRNKYPVLENTDPYVIVETDNCDTQFHNTTKEKALHLFEFSFAAYKNMRRAEYQDVLFFKNFGPFSSGTIQHAHMQMIGLYDNKLSPFDMRHTIGEVIAEQNGTRLILSTLPMNEGYEWYVVGKDIETLATFSQLTSSFIVDNFPTKSYNFTFHYDDLYVIRITPCMRHTPLFLGYRLSQVPSDISEMCRRIRSYQASTT